MSGEHSAHDVGPVEVAVLDPEGVIVAVNDAWTDFCRANGGDPSACGVGLSYLDVCASDPGASSAAVSTAIRDALSGAAPAPVVFTIPCDDERGGARWFDLAVSPRLDDLGHTRGASITLWPVSSPPPPPRSARAPGAPLGEASAWKLVEAAPDGILLIDAAGVVRYANRQLEQLSGRCGSGLLGSSVDDLVPPQHRDRHPVWRAGYARAPRVRTMGKGVAVDLLREDGTLLPVEISLSPVVLDGNTMAVAHVRDVSTLRAEDHARQRLLALLDLDPEAVYVIDAATARIEYANSGAATLLGYAGDELIGMTLDDVDPSASEDLRRTIIDEHHREGPSHVHVIEVVRRTKQGTDIPCDSRGQLVRAEDGSEKLVIVDRDARDRLAAEASHAQRAGVATLVSQVTRMVLSDSTSDEVYRYVVEQTARIMGSENSSLILVDAPRGSFVTVAATGPAATLHLRGGASLDAATFAAWSTPGTATALAGPPATMPAAIRSLAGPGAVAYFPDTSVGGGVLTAFRAAGRDPFTCSDVDVLADLSRQVALVLELGRARDGLQRLKLLEDRQRIARDLHDTVIQDLIGIGMQLSTGSQDEAAAERDDEVVGQLEQTIKRLRHVVFDTRQQPVTGSVTHTLGRPAAEAGRALGHLPTLEVTGPADVLPEAVTGHLVPVVRETLSNVARHAHATSTEVRLTVGEGCVALVVDDDGIGPGARREAGTGILNLQERAAALGGRFTLEPRPEGGSRARWTARF